MELILIKDVENLGFKDDVVTVKPGYGRNFLIPQGFARLATVSAKKVLAENLRQRAHKEANEIAAATKMAEAIKGLEVKISAKIGQGNKLFGSVSNADLATFFSEKGHAIDKRYIQIVGGLVKALGQYTAKVRLHREVNVDVTFDVVADKN
jgi:large subunit ribosomal protein L9